MVRIDKQTLLQRLAKVDENDLVSSLTDAHLAKRVDTAVFLNATLLDEQVTRRLKQAFRDVTILAAGYADERVAHAVGVDAYEQGYLACVLCVRRGLLRDATVKTALYQLDPTSGGGGVIFNSTQ